MFCGGRLFLFVDIDKSTQLNSTQRSRGQRSEIEWFLNHFFAKDRILLFYKNGYVIELCE